MNRSAFPAVLAVVAGGWISVGTARGQEDRSADLLRRLADPAAAVRGEAMAAVQATDRPEVIRAMARLLGDASERYREVAQERLAKFGPGVIEPISPLLGDEDPAVRLGVARAMGKLHDARARGPLAKAATSDALWPVRLAALEALDLCGPHRMDRLSPRAPAPEPYCPAEVIDKALGDPSQAVRRAAANLARGRYKADVQAGWVRRMARDSDIGVRVQAVTAIAEMKRGGPEQAIALLRSPEPPARWTAVRALERWRTPESTAALTVAADDKDPRVWREAVRILQDREACPPEAAVRAARLGPGMHLETVQRVARTGDARSVPLLLEALRDPNGDVQAAAAEGLARLGGPTHVSALIGAYPDADGKAREKILQALGRLGDPTAVPLLAEAASGDDSVRPAAVEALGNIRPLPLGPLEAAIYDPNDRIKWLAVRAVAAADEPAAVRLLTRLAARQPDAEVVGALLRLAESAPVRIPAAALWNGTEDTRRLAIRAAGYIRQADAVAPLSALLRQDESQFIRREAALALARMGEPTLMAQVLAIPVPDPGGSDRWREMVETALTVPGEPTVKALAQAARSDQPFLREIAVGALGRLWEPQALPPLLRAGKDPHAGVRQLAAIGLAHWPEKPSVDALGGLLADPERWVRDEACKALTRIDSPEAWAALEKLAEAERPRAYLWGRAAARGDAAAARSLVGMLGDKDPRARRYAIEALGGMGDERYVPDLAKMLADPGEWVAQEAAYGLAVIGGPKAAAAIAGQAVRNPKLRASAASLLHAMEADGVLAAAGALVAGEPGEAREALFEFLWGLPPSELAAADALFVGALADKDPDLAGQAAEVLRHPGKDAVAPLVKLMGHPKPAVAAAGAAALGRSDDPAAVKALTAALDGSTGALRCAALAGLARRDTPRVAEELVKELEGTEGPVVPGHAEALMVACRSLREGRRQAAVKEVAARLLALAKNAKSSSAGETAVQALGELGDPSAVAPLAALAQARGDEGLQAAAIDALASIGDAAAAPAIVGALNAQLAAVKAARAEQASSAGGLGSGSGAGGGPLVGRGWGHSGWAVASVGYRDSAGSMGIDWPGGPASAGRRRTWSESPIRAAIAALGRFGTPEALAALQKVACESEDYGYRGEQVPYELAVGALAAHPGPKTLPALLAVVDTKTGDRRRCAAARAIGLAGDAAAFDRLAPHLNDDETDFVFAVAQAMVRLGRQGRAGDVAALLRHRNPKARSAVLSALGEGPPRECYDALVGMLFGHCDVRAIRALGRMGDPRAVPVLKAAAIDRDARAEAVAAVALLAPKAEAPWLIRMAALAPSVPLTEAIMQSDRPLGRRVLTASFSAPGQGRLERILDRWPAEPPTAALARAAREPTLLAGHGLTLLEKTDSPAAAKALLDLLADKSVSSRRAFLAAEILRRKGLAEAAADRLLSAAGGLSGQARAERLAIRRRMLADAGRSDE